MVEIDAAVIGAGPAGLMAAETLAKGGAAVTVYDRMPTAGRKFLLAGRGGLNLTHSEPLQSFLTRYGTAETHLRAAVEAFSPDDVRAWAESLGQTTFIGTSGRIFPDAMKASPLLRAWLARLRELGVNFALRHDWKGWDDRGRLLFATAGESFAVRAGATILALGGASWPKLGADGSWSGIAGGAGIEVTPMKPSNSGFDADWTPLFRSRFEGAPLNGIEIRFGERRARGEAIVTKSGIEGGAVYALSSILRDAIDAKGGATILIDLRPQLELALLAGKLDTPRGKQSFSEYLRKNVKLSPAAIGLLYEAALHEGVRLQDRPPRALASIIKGAPVRLIGVAPLERAISTAGGIAFSEIDERFMLRKKLGVFAAGEMLDWEAPTGGYLLQAGFATGKAAAEGALNWLLNRDKTSN